jgi:hypothetical protein
LQVLHLALVALIPITFVFLRLAAGPGDPTIGNLGRLVTIAGVVWTTSIAVGAIVLGSKGDVLKRLLSSYRHLLTMRAFLVASVVILGSVETFLAWNVVAYRTVKFVAPEGAVLLLSDKVGEQREIAVLPTAEETQVRLRIGHRHIAYRFVRDGQLGAFEPIIVTGWWTGDNMPIMRLVKEAEFETLQ